MNTCVLQEWAQKIPWKMQSILFSGLRGPDHMLFPKIKQVSKWMRAVSQNNADPSKPYMNNIVLPKPEELEKELEHCFVHFVHHFADALAVIGYHHPNQNTAMYACRLHYYIAEELFHFQPESPFVFDVRHRTKKDGVDNLKKVWDEHLVKTYDTYLNECLQRFQKP